MKNVTTTLALLLATVASSAVAQHHTFWTTADSLMPAWGFFPLRAQYGGTRPIGRWAAWCAGGNKGTLTWVARFPKTAEYHVWVRKYGGYGAVAVLVDERPTRKARGGQGGGRYVWNHVGSIQVEAGTRHVDIRVSTGMFDAVVFTTDAKLGPSKKSLPTAVKNPTIRTFRSYRARRRKIEKTKPFQLHAIESYGGATYDWSPGKGNRPLAALRAWGSANQFIHATFAICNNDKTKTLEIDLPQLIGPAGTKLPRASIDLRVVHVRARINSLFEGRKKTLVPELLLRDDRTKLPPKGRQGGYGGGHCVTRIPAGQSRQIWVTVQLRKDAPAGTYRGKIRLTPSAGAAAKVLPLVVEVLPIDLQPAVGYYGIYYPSQCVDPKRPRYVSKERYLAELQDQVRHGLNTTTLYGGFSTLQLAKQAGMHKAPCLMHWPDGNARRQVAQARQLGFDDLYYYGVDEPTKPKQIERCRKEAERRLKQGLHMLTAINSTTAQQATRDFIDRPVYNIYVFGGPKNSAVSYVKKKGFRPVSYWVSATAFPLPYRALTGLYNRACGYLGSSPWSYQDTPSNKLYDPDAVNHKMSYPDERGLPIPTLAWEAHRAGIDDVRYLEALDRAIAAAKNIKKPSSPLAAALKKARQARQSFYESISGRYFVYLCRLQPGDLAKARRAIADATVQLVAEMNR